MPSPPSSTSCGRMVAIRSFSPTLSSSRDRGLSLRAEVVAAEAGEQQRDADRERHLLALRRDLELVSQEARQRVAGRLAGVAGARATWSSTSPARRGRT